MDKQVIKNQVVSIYNATRSAPLDATSHENLTTMAKSVMEYLEASEIVEKQDDEKAVDTETVEVVSEEE